MTRNEVISLRDYIDTQIAALDRRFTDINRATDLASAAVAQRLEAMNEFREQLRNQADTFVTTAEIEAKLAIANTTHAEYDRRIQILEQTKLNTSAHDVLERRIQILEQSIANMQGRIWAIAAGFGVVTVGINIALHFIH